MITSMEEILEGADKTEKHVAAGGTVGAENPFLHPATEDQVTAVAEALQQPKLVVNTASHGLAAELQLKAQVLAEKMRLVEHEIEGKAAQLADMAREMKILQAALHAYHETE